MNRTEEVIERFEEADRVMSLLYSDAQLELYLAGGLACLFTSSSIRPTMDFDFVDNNILAKYLRVLNLLGDYDLIDISVSAISADYKNRVKVVYTGKNLIVHVLSPEDIIVMKLNRYSEIDKEDIRKLLMVSDCGLLETLLEQGINSLDNVYSKEIYLKHVALFKKEVL